MEKTTMNKVELTGFVGMEPKVVTLKDGKSFTCFSLATDESYKNAQGEWVKNTTWHSIVLWNKKDASASDEIKKGQNLSLTGKLRNRNYTDKNGVKHYVTEVHTFAVEVAKAA